MFAKLKSESARLWKDESGAALLEYSMLLAIITAAAVGLILGAGNWIQAQWVGLQGDLSSAPTSIDGTTGENQ
jgi:pilus assembly protein Flp/PilA